MAADEKCVTDKIARQGKLYTSLDAKLAENKYFGGEEMSIGDLYAFTFMTSFTLNKRGRNPK